MKPFVQSNFERVPGDYYPTVDSRCPLALVETLDLSGHIVDCCAPQGSGIVDALQKLGYLASGEPDSYAPFDARWVVTNPPYAKNLVVNILRDQIERVESGEHYGFASLMRTGFDHGKTYAELFQRDSYAGQIKLLFRPWWSEDHSISPIHSFVWHIWKHNHRLLPTVQYWPNTRK